MANSREAKNTRQNEFKALDPAHQLRIRRTLQIAGIWFGGVIVSALIFVLAKPTIDKKRQERMKQPGYKPIVLKRPLPDYTRQSKRDK